MGMGALISEVACGGERQQRGRENKGLLDGEIVTRPRYHQQPCMREVATRIIRRRMAVKYAMIAASFTAVGGAVMAVKSLWDKFKKPKVEADESR